MKTVYQYFDQGKQYKDQITVLRYKIVCYWYCTRFDRILEAIERDNYILRPEYPEQKSVASWLKIIFAGISLVIQHIIGNISIRSNEIKRLMKN